jgi:hypothetical protein
MAAAQDALRKRLLSAQTCITMKKDGVKGPWPGAGFPADVWEEAGRLFREAEAKCLGAPLEVIVAAAKAAAFARVSALTATAFVASASPPAPPRPAPPVLLPPEPTYDSSHVDLKGRLPASLYAALLPFQREGVVFAAAREGRALIADEMGLGKTIQAIATAVYYGDEWPLLVVCPSALSINWRIELLRWVPSLPPSKVTIVGKGADVLPLPSAVGGGVEAGAVIISYELAAKKYNAGLLPPGRFRVVIADESHLLKTAATKRATALTPILQRAKRVLLLSGTPALNRPRELFSQIATLKPSLFPDYRAFTIRYCAGRQATWGWNDSGSSNLPELQAKLEAHILIRRLKKNVLSLPPKEKSRVRVAVTAAAQVVLTGLWDEKGRLLKKLAEATASGDEEKITGARNAVQGVTGRLWRAVGIGKCPATMTHVFANLRPRPGRNFVEVPPPRSGKRKRGAAKAGAGGGESDRRESAAAGGSTSGDAGKEGDAFDEEAGGFFVEEAAGGNIGPAVEAIGAGFGLDPGREALAGSKRPREEGVSSSQREDDGTSFVLSPTQPVPRDENGLRFADQVAAAAAATAAGADAGAGGQSAGPPPPPGDDRVDKLLLFAHHSEVLDYMSKRLTAAGVRHVQIDGSVTPKRKHELKELFQTDADTQVALIGILAGGVGLSFVAAHRAIFAELHWTPGHLLQCEDRIHRIGQTARSVSIHYCTADETGEAGVQLHAGNLDLSLWQMLSEKFTVIEEALAKGLPPPLDAGVGEGEAAEAEEGEGEGAAAEGGNPMVEDLPPEALWV